MKTRTKIAMPVGISDRNIKLVLKELNSVSSPLDEESNRLYHELEEMEKRLLETPSYTELNKRLEETRSQAWEEKQKFVKRVQKVRQRYYANGPTAAVMKEIQALVEEAS